MSKLNISKGYRKFLRQKKAEIRRRILDATEQERQIQELYKDILEKSKLLATKKIPMTKSQCSSKSQLPNPKKI